MEYVTEHVPGGVEEMMRGFRDPRLVGFFQQRFLPSSFYDVVPLITAGYVCARQSRKTFADFVRTRTRYQADRDINGIYRVLLKLTSPARVLDRLPVLISQYCDFVGPSESTLVAPGHAVLRGARMPMMLMPWFNLVNEVYVECVLGAAGARRVDVRHHPDQPSGEQHGFPAAEMHYEVRWE